MQIFQSTADAVTLATAPDASCYLMPASAMYPAIDSFKTLAILFQVRMSAREDSRHHALLGVPLQCLVQQRTCWAKPARPADEVVAQIAAGKTHNINRRGMYELVRASNQDQMGAALQGLREWTGLTEKDLPGCMPVLFFATMPQFFNDGFRRLQRYVASGVSVQHLSFVQLVAGRQTAC